MTWSILQTIVGSALTGLVTWYFTRLAERKKVRVALFLGRVDEIEEAAKEYQKAVLYHQRGNWDTTAEESIILLEQKCSFFQLMRLKLDAFLMPDKQLQLQRAVFRLKDEMFGDIAPIKPPAAPVSREAQEAIERALCSFASYLDGLRDSAGSILALKSPEG